MSDPRDLKRQVVLDVIKATEAMIAAAKESRNDSIEESKSHKGAMESRYDTFKEEAQALMAGQDVRIAELDSIIAILTTLLARPPKHVGKVGVFSLVDLEDESAQTALYFLLPAGGGITSVIGEKKVTTINVSSPVARAIMGTHEGEDVECEIAGVKKIFSIISIS